MKKYFIIISCLIALVLVGCKYPPKSVKMKSCEEAIKGLMFDYPYTWGECGTHTGNVIFFAKDYLNTRVSLELHLLTTKRKPSFATNEHLLKVDNPSLEIYSIANQFVITFDNEIFYKGHWVTVKSLDDFITPKLNNAFSKEDKENILMSVQKANDNFNPKAHTGKSSKELNTCEMDYQNLKFKYPINWEECYVNNDGTRGPLRFAKIYNGNKVWLRVNARELMEDNKYEILANVEYLVNSNNLKISHFTVPGGGLENYGLIINDERFYHIEFSTIAGEKHSEFIPSIHNPYHDFTQEDMLNILKSVEIAE